MTKVGGISEERRIAWMAQEHGVRFIPHGWNTAVGLAADLQLASAFPDTDLVEYLAGSPYVDEIAAGGWQLDADGMLPIPDAPGLGVDPGSQGGGQLYPGREILRMTARRHAAGAAVFSQGKNHESTRRKCF